MKSEHILIPVGIAGVVVAIWAALRKPSAGPPLIVETSPSISPLGWGMGQGQTPLAAPAVQNLTPANVAAVTTQAIQQGLNPAQTLAPGTSASGVPSYSAQNLDTRPNPPMRPAPVPGNIPNFYGPIQEFARSVLPAARTPITSAVESQPSKSGACSCQSHKSCSVCDHQCSVNRSRFPDGRGGCMAVSRAKQVEQAMRSNPEGFVRASDNILSSDIHLFNVYRRTVMDFHNQPIEGEPPPAGFILSPV